MTRVGKHLHRSIVLPVCVALLASVLVAPGAGADFPNVTVVRSAFDSTLQHNIPDLRIVQDGQVHDVPFLGIYEATGGVTRWGFPTSEVLEEEEGHLTQYYQRGVMDWHRSPTCGTPSGFCMERRLAWDFFGGGSGGSQDQGVEMGPSNPNPGPQLGPWGNRVSNVSSEGIQTGFLDFFERNGGVTAFGFPKTEARRDTNQPGTLHIPPDFDVQPGFIRQYFQAAVLEFHAQDPGDPVKLLLLGDKLRDLTYPNEAWKGFRSFRNAEPLTAGQVYEVERVVPGLRPVQAVISGLNSVTERCSATTWQPPRGAFCLEAQQFQSGTLDMQVLNGDVVRTRVNSPDLNLHALLQLLQAGVVRGTAVLSTGARLVFGRWEGGAQALRVEEGAVGFEAQPGTSLSFTTPDGEGSTTGTLFLVNVVRAADGSTTTSIKVMSGEVMVRSAQVEASVGGGQEAQLMQGSPPSVGPMSSLTTGETEQLTLLNQMSNRLGSAPVPAPLLSVQPEILTFSTPGTEDLTIRNAGGANLSWTANADDPWLSVSPRSGGLTAQSEQVIQVEVDGQRLPSINQAASGSVTVSSNAGEVVLPVEYSPAPCPVLGNVALDASADPQSNAVTLSWQSSGGCAPFSGTLSARYQGETPYQTYSIKAEQGSLLDDPPPRCEGTFTVVYDLTLRDSVGQQGTASDTARVTWIC